MSVNQALVLAILGINTATHGDAFAQLEEPGDRQATSRVLIYDDDDATTVVTSIVDVDAMLPGEVSIGAYGVLDAVSSASVDVVSAATGRWEENRVEVGARVQTVLAGGQHSVAVARSQENDWLSHTVSFTTNHELFERNTLLSAGYAYTANQVGRAMDPNFERSQDTHSLELGVGQLLDKHTRAGASYSYQRTSGFQSSPYRFVRAVDGTAIAERHPDKRQRHAISVFALRSLADYVSIRIGYRLYRDDWGIWSNTGTLRFAFEFGDRFHAAVETRYYLQDKADFYRGNYPTSFRFMSRDRELSSFADLGGGGELGVQIGPARIDGKFGAIQYRFRNFPPLSQRIALLISGGATIQW